MANPNQARDRRGRFTSGGLGLIDEDKFRKRERKNELELQLRRAQVAVGEHEARKALVDTDTDGIRWDKKMAQLKARLKEARDKLRSLR